MILKMAREGKWNGRFAPYGYRLENGELVIAENEVEETMTELKSQIYKLKKNRYRSLKKAMKDYEYTQIVGDVNALSAFKNETCHRQ